MTCGRPQISLSERSRRHISSSAPWARFGLLGRMQAGVPGQRRDLLVQARVVLHRARAERVRARVEVEVAARETVVVAHDLGLGDLGQSRAFSAQQLRRDQLVERRSRARRRRQSRRAAAFDRAARRSWSLARAAAASGYRRWSGRWGEGAGVIGDFLADWRLTPLSGSNSSRPPISATARPSASARRSMSSRERRSVIATSSPSSYSGYSRASGYPAAIPSSLTRSKTAATGASSRIANSRATGASCSSSTPSTAASVSRA